MSDIKKEAAYLVGDMNYLYLKAAPDGYSYDVFRADQPRKVTDGKIYLPEVEEARSPMIAARTLALKKAGLAGEPAAEVSVNMLERFMDSDVRKRVIRDPDSLPKNDIRFITSNYKELFRIPDGGTITVDYPDRHFSAKCRHMDSYHTAINGECYHICQFAEMIERNGGICRPEPETLQTEAAWKLGTKNILMIHADTGTWDYTLLDQKYLDVADGRLDRPELSIKEARDVIMDDLGIPNRSRTAVDYKMVAEKAEAASMEERGSVIEKLESMKGSWKPDAKAPAPKRKEEVL